MSHDWEPFFIQLQRALEEDVERDDQKCTGMGDNLIFKMIREHLQNTQDLNDTIEILKADNLRLVNKYDNEKLKWQALQEKLKTIVKNQELFIKMKKDYNAILKSLEEDQPSKGEDRKTSMNTFMDTSDKSVQISMECLHCLTKKNLNLIDTDQGRQRKSVACQVTDYEDGCLSRRGVLRLQDDINILKELLNAREIKWGKLATRERVQRLQLHRLHAQLEDLHQLELKQRIELEHKNKRLQELTRDLEREKLQVAKLKKKTGKLEGPEKDLIQELPTRE